MVMYGWDKSDVGRASTDRQGRSGGWSLVGRRECR